MKHVTVSAETLTLGVTIPAAAVLAVLGVPNVVIILIALAAGIALFSTKPAMADVAGAHKEAVLARVGLGLALALYGFAGLWLALILIPPIFTGGVAPEVALGDSLWLPARRMIIAWAVVVVLSGAALILIPVWRKNPGAVSLMGLLMIGSAGLTFKIATFGAAMRLADYADGVLHGPFPPLARVMTAVAVTAGVLALAHIARSIRGHRTKIDQRLQPA